MKINKWLKLGLIALAFVMIGVITFATVNSTVLADDSSPEDPDETLPFSGFGPGRDHPARGRAAQFMRYGREAYLQSVADQSGIALEDLQAAQDNRVALNEVLSEAGFNEDEIDEILLNAQYAIVDQSVTDGRLTAEEAAERKAQLAELAETRVEWQANREAYHTAWLELLAEKTGLSVEELEAAQEAGTPIHQLLEESMTVEEAQALIDETRQELLDQAVAEGLITPEQAENWQNRPEQPTLRERFTDRMDEEFGEGWQGKLRDRLCPDDGFERGNGERPETNSDTSFGRGGRGPAFDSLDS